MFRLPPHFPRLYPHFAVFPLVVRKSTSKSQGVQSWESHPLHKPQRMGHPTEYRAPETPAPHRSKTPSSNGRTDANRIESNRNLSAIACGCWKSPLNRTPFHLRACACRFVCLGST